MQDKLITPRSSYFLSHACRQITIMLGHQTKTRRMGGPRRRPRSVSPSISPVQRRRTRDHIHCQRIERGKGGLGRRCKFVACHRSCIGSTTCAASEIRDGPLQKPVIFIATRKQTMSVCIVNTWYHTTMNYPPSKLNLALSATVEDI